MERQGTWHPSVYPDTRCRRCMAATEDVDHLLSSPLVLAAMPDALCLSLEHHLAEDETALVTARAAVAAIRPTLDHHSLKGFGDLRWAPLLYDAGLAMSMTRMIVDCLAVLTFDQIWLHRCDATLSWEHSAAIINSSPPAPAAGF